MRHLIDPLDLTQQEITQLLDLADRICWKSSCNSMQFWCTTFSKCVILYGMNNSEGNR